MKIKELDNELMAQFIMSSMAGKDNPTKLNNLQISDDVSIANLQQQASTWCTRAKGFLLSDIADAESMQGQVVSEIKISMNNDYRNNRAMSYLYNNTDMSIIVQQVSMLTMHSLFKAAEDINNVDDMILRQSLNLGSVSAAIGFYTYFTILNNPNFDTNTFDEIFIRSWYSYFFNWNARLMMFRMNGNEWKLSFKGVLLD